MNNLSKLLQAFAEASIRIGEVRLFGGATIPPRWKICDGSLVSRTTYSTLFNVIGTTYGGGDGETTFAIPDTQGRVLIGIGESSATGHSAHILGQMSGEESHALITSEMPSHNHTSGHGYNNVEGGSAVRAVSNNYYAGDGWSGAITQGSGSNSPHNTMQPYSCCNYIVYTGVLEQSEE